MMPAQSVESSPNHKVIVHTCDVCGADAPYGYEVNLRRALATGDKRHAGLWRCQQHRVPE